MPDWSYQTLLRPVLFMLPPDRARDLTLTITGSLGEMPLGTAIIDLMGHMSPPAAAKVSAIVLDFPGPVGLGAGLDVDGRACRAFSRFGFGFLEFGPVTEHPTAPSVKIERNIANRMIRYPDQQGSRGVEALAQRLERCRGLGVPIGVRLGDGDRKNMIPRLAPVVDFFTIDAPVQEPPQWGDEIAALREAAGEMPLLIAIQGDANDETVSRMVRTAIDCGVRGVIVGCGALHGAPIFESSVAMVRHLSAEFDDLTIIASGGVMEPAQALAFLDAGAALVQIHSGLVFSGPGLPKRINEAVAYRRQSPADTAPARGSILTRIPAWIWAGALGMALSITAIVVGIVAMTRIVLPYDEAFVGLTRAQLAAINPRLLPFMAHDRVTVAGTMLSTGILYVGLAWGGIRHGQHWAQKAFVISALSGFATFFLFIGYGYFDPLHAVLTLSLLPLFVLSLIARKVPPTFAAPPNLINDRRWHLAQWGQLLFVTIGFGLIVAGIAISSVGVTSVFVPEDLHFMQTTAEVLAAANPRLVPLVAHDRAGFGGNLVSVGLAVILLALWGFRQGQRWVWWTLLLSGLAGFAGAIGVHLSVGYLDLWHLFPALLALVMFVAGAALAGPYLLGTHKVASQNG
jgi:dihydroorotate dehydrogenase